MSVIRKTNFLFYTTNASDPLLAAVGLEVLEVVTRNGWVDWARSVGKSMFEGHSSLESGQGYIDDARCCGFLDGLR